jgi:CDP-diacylglycerol--glycerol-3-phosphate 3-phosphatidyltransferase
MVPVIVALILVDGDRALYAAAALFLVASASDFLDGYLARRHSMTTVTGEWLDPLSDKLLVLTPIVVLVYEGAFPWWGALIIIGREIAVSLLRYSLGRRELSMPASLMGKVKAVSQMIAITLYLLPGVAGWARVTSLVVALVFTVWSGAEYFVKARAEKDVDPAA